jgi:hypothetical protein
VDCFGLGWGFIVVFVLMVLNQGVCGGQDMEFV